MNPIIKEINHRLKQTTQRMLAIELGISPSYLSDIIRGNRGIPDDVAEKLGWLAIHTPIRWVKKK